MSSQSDWDPQNWKPQPIYSNTGKTSGYDGRYRGFWLTAWIIASGLLSAAALFIIAASRVNNPIILLLAGLSVVNLISLGGIWQWKKWGAYGSVAVTIISPIFEVMFARPTIADCIAPFVQIGILYLLVMNRWSDFD